MGGVRRDRALNESRRGGFDMFTKCMAKACMLKVEDK